MKKITAIVLLSLFLFNLVGYRLLFVYANNLLDKQAETSFDNNQYDNESVITIKVPLNMPYLANQTNFERVDGKIKIEGKVYRYIKRKIVNGEMILACVVDKDAMQLNKAQNDCFKTITGLGDNNNSSKPTNSSGLDFFKALTVYNNSHTLSYNFSSFKSFEKENIITLDSKPLNFPKKPPVQPPDTV